MNLLVKQRILNLLGLTNSAGPFILRAQRLRGTILRSNERMGSDYLRTTRKPKLHIGAGSKLIEGWLNTDVDFIPAIMRMDATQPFPFPDSTFEYVYTEHMIEHVPYPKAAAMLRECRRVMRRGGVIRVVTPNLAAVVGLYTNKLEPDQERYLSWLCKMFVPQDCPQNATSAINVMFRSWGHQFIYDEETLRTSMDAAGFRCIERNVLGESRYPDLRNIENQQRYPEGLLNFESIALEGIK
jgi:predicted SAM-dependent methyltransferase